MAYTTRGAAGQQGHTCLQPARGLQHLAPASQAATHRPLSSRRPALRDAVPCYAAGPKVQPSLHPGKSCITFSPVVSSADVLFVNRSALRRWRRRRLRLQTTQTMTA